MQLLVIAATRRELEGAEGIRTLACGIGPAAARAATELAIAQERPDAILHVGIAGMRRQAGLHLLDVVVGRDAVDCDAPAGVTAVVPPHPVLLEVVIAALPGARVESIGTSARVGGTHGVAVEAMEGHAVLLAAAAAGVPAVEVRVVSNEIEERDRERWLFDEGFARVATTTRVLVDALGGLDPWPGAAVR